ncbi:MAG: NAD(P)/FAD-dependent oxidoreductase [Clostridiaceae bacterium]|mgnify:CR=1 FL=1|jgi:thioredoxin reductase (NADPH)|nr:NAD(P)/FAD-dependent oxidoreductase [Clostridiaceae bacterium]
MNDVIIIGKGPAGISAALYTIRANLKTLVIGLNDSTLYKAGEIENYYGFPQPISGKQLLENGEKQALRLGAEILEEEVIGIEKEDVFVVKTVKGNYRALSVLIATGQKTADVKIKNINKFEGKGISYCTTCDGFFFRGRKVGVLGYKDFALHEARELIPITNDITIFTNGQTTEFSADSSELAGKFEFNEKPISAFEGGDYLEKVVFQDSSEYPIDGIFIAYGSASTINFALKMGILTKNRAIVVNENQETNIEGLFAAGDCTGVFKQISVAVGQGAVAGRRITEYVRDKKRNM